MFAKITRSYVPEYYKIYANYTMVLQPFFSEICQKIPIIMLAGIQVRCAPLGKTSALRASVFPRGLQRTCIPRVTSDTHFEPSLKKIDMLINSEYVINYFSSL